jgi:hypothetical protein
MLAPAVGEAQVAPLAVEAGERCKRCRANHTTDPGDEPGGLHERMHVGCQNAQMVCEVGYAPRSDPLVCPRPWLRCSFRAAASRQPAARLGQVGIPPNCLMYLSFVLQAVLDSDYYHANAYHLN